MRPLTFQSALVGIAALLPLLSAAQQAPQTPPKLEPLEEGEPPAITIRKEEGERRITEKKEGGKVTEIKVQSGKSTYYLKANDQPGNAQPGDAQSNTNRPAQWKVLEFDLGTVREAPPESGTQADAPPPPAPPAPPATPAKN
ncbi:MAG TPA: DUF2782 domain-containing protein [Paucimonas sp.]|nr:DUF2782 domain-containing protein [Paucimonas sp.]